MDEDTKNLLAENNELLKENTTLLHKIIRYQRLSSWLNVIKWVIVIGSALGALYYLQPIFDNLIKTYSDLLGSFN